MGHVTEAQAHSKQQKESQLGIAFNQTVMEDGRTAPLPMSIQAVIAPLNQNLANENPGTGGLPAPPNPGAQSGNSPGRTGGMEQPPNSLPSGGVSSGSTSSSTQRAPITAKTQGIVGFSNYKLSTAADAQQGSVVSSDKGNVKLENGTLMLLRVNQ